MATNSLTEYAVTRRGDLVSYEGDIVSPGMETEFRPVTPMVRNEVFTAEMRLLDFERGRSSAVFIWITKNGRRFQMFMVDMVETIRLFGIRKADNPPQTVPGRLFRGREKVNGYSSGRWRIVKRGQNYGLQPVGEE